MGLFNKIKNIFKKDETEEIKEELVKVEDTTKEEVKEEVKVEKESVKIYEKGLTKSRENFVSKLINLTKKYNKATEEYFDELEEILIMADIGVNTVMSFIDRLKNRAKSENITDPSELKEIIVDELFIR